MDLAYVVRRTCCVIAIALAALSLVRPAQAAGDIARGEKIASRWCAACHETEKGAVRLDETQPASFQEIADTPGMGELALKVFFQTPHKEMPNFSVTTEVRDDLIAYITSLKGHSEKKR